MIGGLPFEWSRKRPKIAHAGFPSHVRPRSRDVYEIPALAQHIIMHAPSPFQDYPIISSDHAEVSAQLGHG